VSDRDRLPVDGSGIALAGRKISGDGRLRDDLLGPAKLTPPKEQHGLGQRMCLETMPPEFFGRSQLFIAEIARPLGDRRCPTPLRAESDRFVELHVARVPESQSPSFTRVRRSSRAERQVPARQFPARCHHTFTAAATIGCRARLGLTAPKGYGDR